MQLFIHLLIKRITTFAIVVQTTNLDHVLVLQAISTILANNANAVYFRT